MLLAPLPPTIRSSFDVRGRSDDGGRPLPWDKLVPTTQHLGLAGKATLGTCRATVAADEAIRTAGGEGLRVTEAYRPWSVQHHAHLGYVAWLRAGRPKPGGPGWATGMRAAATEEPGGSGHGWGGSEDWHVYAIGFPGAPAGSNAALSKLWDVVIPLGWRPVIREPRLGAAECWHFDHWGPLDKVRRMYAEHRGDGDRYRDAYSNAHAAGHALVGTWQGDGLQERTLQALLLLGGEWIGLCDGSIGPMSRSGWERLTGKIWTRELALPEAIGAVQAVPAVREAIAEL